MKILAVGDIHIGRRSSKIPEELEGRRFSAAEAWKRAVDLALEEAVDAVVLTGDVVDQENRFHEALGPLERGLRDLADRGVETFAVAGNHDHEVLRRLTRVLGGERFHLLGAGGKWERRALERDGRVLLHVDGWSFPADHVRECPAKHYDLDRAGEAPILGLLHADLDQSTSHYAPVTRADLEALPPDVWVLGHQHDPLVVSAEGVAPLIFCPGSLQALDPGETGLHGAWILEMESGGKPALRQVPLSRVVYRELDIDVQDTPDLEALDQRISTRIFEDLQDLAGRGGALEFVSYRLRITGRTRLHLDMEVPLQKYGTEFTPDAGTVQARVERVWNETRPAVDLVDLARGSDPPAVVAQTILALEESGGDGRDTPLLRDLHQAHARLFQSAEFMTFLEDPRPSPEATRNRVLRESYRLLDALLVQKEVAL